MKIGVFLVLFICLFIFSCNKKDNTGFGNAPDPIENPDKAEGLLKILTAKVIRESGTWFEYIDQKNKFYENYPEKAKGFDLAELNYYIDIEYKGKQYKNIQIKVEKDDLNYHMKLKVLASLVTGINKGSLIQIKEDAFSEIVTNKRNYLISGNEIRMGVE